MTDARKRDGAPLEELVRCLAPTGSPSDCPAELDLAALAEGRLDGDERAPLEEHVARCERCRVVLAAVAVERADGLTPVAARKISRPLLAAAAALLVVLTAAVAARWGRDTRSVDERLFAAAERLAAERPELFSSFRPLDADERRDAPAGVLRGGPVLLSPIGRVLSARPTFRWEPVRGRASYQVRVVAGSGEAVWSATADTTELTYPNERVELEPGSYVVEVVAAGPLGEERGLAAFEVVTASERAALRAAEGAILSAVDPTLARLLAAHYAMRSGFWSEAEALARAHLEQSPDDPAGRETLHHLLVRKGASEAAAFAQEGGSKR